MKDNGQIASADATRRSRLLGIGVILVAVIGFSAVDALTKYLNTQMNTIEVVWARSTCAFLAAFVIANPVSHPGMLRSNRPLLQLIRSLLLVVAGGANMLALNILRLDQTASIAFSAPLIVAALAGPLLGEWIGVRRWAAIAVGFLGVLVITRPGAGEFNWAMILAFFGAFCYALYLLMTRILSLSDSSATTLFYSNLVGAAVTTVAVPFFWTTPDSVFNVAMMLAIGIVGMVSHYLVIIAYRLTPASVVAPFSYAQIVAAVAIGYVFFHDLPDRWTLLGAAIVIASGIYLLHRERVRGIRRGG